MKNDDMMTPGWKETLVVATIFVLAVATLGALIVAGIGWLIT